MNRLRTIENRKADGTLISGYTYTLATDGNRTRVDELPNLRAVVYKYDRLNRLTDEENLDPTNGDETISYTYDNFGNRITKTDAEKTIVYTYDDNDRLQYEIGPDHLVSYQYDDNGNTIEKFDGENTTTYGYDPQNRLVTAQTPEHYLEYQYDMNGIRVAYAIDGVLTRYTMDKNRDYAQVFEERDADGNLIVSYVYWDDMISQNRNGVDNWYHYDGQMSVRQLTDSAGNVTDTYDYDAFGVLRGQTGETVNNYRYTGEQYDPNSWFYYLRARWMNPGNGRFVTIDPWRGNIYDSASLHKYFYVHANPIINIDSSGSSKASFSQRARRLCELADVEKVPDVISKPMKKLKENLPTYLKAYDLPGCHRTSNMVDRLMRRMDRHLFSTLYFHGHLAAAKLSVRGWALIHNFAPCNPTTVKRHDGWRCPAEWLNKSRYHDNWLQNLLVSSSMGGFRHHLLF